MAHSTKFTTGYMDNAVFDLDKVVSEAVDALLPHTKEFDTLVGTGFSGGMVIPMIALALKKKFILIRKETDDSHHGSGRILGELGERWIFVDDFVSSGRTKRRVIEKIIENAVAKEQETMYVGQYCYARCEINEFQPTDEEDQELYREQTMQERERVQRRDREFYDGSWSRRQPTLSSEESIRALRRKLTGEPASGEEPLAEWEKALLRGEDISGDTVMEIKTYPAGVMPMPKMDFSKYYEETVREIPMQTLMQNFGFIKTPAQVETSRESFQKLLDRKKSVKPIFSEFTKADFEKRA